MFNSLGKSFEVAGYAFLDTGYILCDKRNLLGYARSEEPVVKVYSNLVQRMMNARSLLKDRHDRLT